MSMACTCGALLLKDVGEGTVTTLLGEEIPFRRSSDYVICDACGASFRVVLLRAAVGVPN